MDTYLFSKVVFKVIKSPAMRWELNKKFPQLFFAPHMRLDEYSLFKELCRGRKVVLEYGSGGSTIYLLKENKDVFSVESNPDFYGYMNSIRFIKRELEKRLHYSYIDLGPTNQWGKPLTKENHMNWGAYYSKVWNDINAAKTKIDIIFIDGRFRVCCCLFSILKVIEYGWKDIVFIIHDFWRRNQYHVVLKFLQEIKSSNSLAAFKLRDDIDMNEVNQMLQEYALVTQ